MVTLLPRIYPITDVHISGMSHAAQVELLAAGGATLVQLREKKASPREFYEAALKAVATAHELGVRVVVNDRIDVALAVHADGVHLGQDDMPVRQARLLLGNQRILGFSTHSVKQALEADSQPVDYIAIGPIFPTNTKASPDPVVGLEALEQLRGRLTKPLVAIGGITLENTPSVIDAGSDSLAIISDLVGSADIASRTRAFIDIARQM